MSRSLVEIVGDIEDPRRGNAIRHNLVEVLTIALLAAICDYTRFTEMELFGQEREEWLRSFLALENGIPSHDTFGDIFAAIDPEQMRLCLIEWTESIREKIQGEVVAVDGKTIRGSKCDTEGKRAIHVVSAWAAENGLVLGELATDEKSNEITAIPKLLRMLKLNGCIVTIDAMGTQKEVTSVIRECGADYLLPVKENHPSLLEDISLYFSTEKEACDYAKTVEKSHGRYEKRECLVTEEIAWLHGREKWCDLSGIAMIRSAVQRVGSAQSEQTVHYLLFSKHGMTAADVLRVKRRHWSIENSLHWVLDVDFGEDSMRMRLGNAAENMNILRHLALNLLNAESSFKGSLNLKRKKCALSPSYLLKVFAS